MGTSRSASLLTSTPAPTLTADRAPRRTKVEPERDAGAEHYGGYRTSSIGQTIMALVVAPDTERGRVQPTPHPPSTTAGSACPSCEARFLLYAVNMRANDLTGAVGCAFRPRTR